MEPSSVNNNNEISEPEPLPNSEKEREYLLGKKMQYMLNIEDIYENFENTFRKFDDGIIMCCQHIHPKKEGMLNKILGNIFRALAGIITFFTMIENGQFYCLFLQLIGDDYLAKWFLYVGFISAFFTQIPKRFLFRKRPYMVDRALALKRYRTSSFPSRAVVCGSVYTVAILIAINYHRDVIMGEDGMFFNVGLIILLMLLVSLAASWSRIYFGAHYPSDCLFGLFYGALIVSIAYGALHFPDLNGCVSCYADACYAKLEQYIMNSENFHVVNLGNLIVSSLIIFFVFLVFTSPPLLFWDKSAPIFGSYFAVFVARIMMTCPTSTQFYTFPTRKFKDLSLEVVFGALLISAANVGLSLATAGLSGKFKRAGKWIQLLIEAILFWIFFIVFIIVIIVYRLYALKDD